MAILLLVKRTGPVTGSATIRYHDIGDYLTQEQKLDTVRNAIFDEIEWTDVVPNEEGDWINQRSSNYLDLRPVSVIQSERSIPSLKPLFERSSREVMTGRDAWVFNSSGEKLRELVKRQVAFYNEQVESLRHGAERVASDPRQFKWESSAENHATRGLLAEVRSSGFGYATYRPFFRQHLLYGQGIER